ncbi:MAG: hypothetical protein ACHQNE_00205 [Candidatus Kapaibacterium sp.]
MESLNRFEREYHAQETIVKKIINPLNTLGHSPAEETIMVDLIDKTRNDREVVATLLRKNFDDYSKMTHDDGTVDYLVTGLLQAQNTTLWMLRRYLP